MARRSTKTITSMITPSTCSIETKSIVPAVSWANHVWIIRNFSYCLEEQASKHLSLRSSTFRGRDGEEWHIILWPNGKDDPDIISMDLWLHAWSDGSVSRDGENVDIKYKVSILNASQIPVYNICSNFRPKIGENECEHFLFKSYLMDNRSSLLPNDSLTIMCDIKTSNHNNNQPFPVPESKLVDQFKSMLNGQEFGDTIIEADGKEFLVYQGILRIRSPVFAAMFEHSLKEKKSNRVVIEDAKHEVVQEMLTYIYTDRAPNLKDMAQDLLAIADKYDLERLRVMCEEALSAELTKEDAINVLMLADTCNAVHLKKHVINFIIANSCYFMEKSIWTSIIDRLYAANRPKLITQVTFGLLTYNLDDARSEAVLTFKKQNFSKLKGPVFSTTSMIRNLPWKIMITQTTGSTETSTQGILQKSLSFFLQCDGASNYSSWSCDVHAELAIVSQKDGVKDFVKEIHHIFYEKDRMWGLDHFLPWSLIMNPTIGFIKNDTVIFRVHVRAKAPILDLAPPSS